MIHLRYTRFVRNPGPGYTQDTVSFDTSKYIRIPYPIGNPTKSNRKLHLTHYMYSRDLVDAPDEPTGVLYCTKSERPGGVDPFNSVTV